MPQDFPPPSAIAGVDLRRLPLEPRDAFVLGCVDGRSSVRDISLQTGLPEEDVDQILRRLTDLGALNWAAHAPGAAAVPGTAAVPGAAAGAQNLRTLSEPEGSAVPESSEQKSSKDPVSLAGIVQGSRRQPGVYPHQQASTAPASPGSGAFQVRTPAEISLPELEADGAAFAPTVPAPHRDLLDAADQALMATVVDLDEELKETIVRLHARLEKLSHYELLGIPEDAEKKDIKAAYFDSVSLFHTDRYFGKQLGGFKPKMERIFSALTKAHDTLTKKRDRAEYDLYLQSRRSTLGVRESVSPLSAARPLYNSPGNSAYGSLEAPQIPRAPRAPTILEGSELQAAAPREAALRSPLPPRMGGVEARAVPERPARAPAPTAAVPGATAPGGAAASGAAAAVGTGTNGPVTVRSAPPPPMSRSVLPPPAPSRPGQEPSPAPSSSLSSSSWVPPAGARMPDPDAARRLLARKLGLRPQSSQAPSLPQSSEMSGTGVDPRVADDLRQRFEARQQGPSKQAAHYIELARGAIEKSDWNSALNTLRLALQLTPEDSVLQTLFAQTEREADKALAPRFQEQGRYEESEGHYDRAARSYTRAARGLQSAEYFDKAARCLLLAHGEPRSIVELARQAVRLDGAKLEYRLTLAKAYERAGMRTSATGEVSRVLEQDPHNMEAQALRKLFR